MCWLPVAMAVSGGPLLPWLGSPPSGLGQVSPNQSSALTPGAQARETGCAMHLSPSLSQGEPCSDWLRLGHVPSPEQDQSSWKLWAQRTEWGFPPRETRRSGRWGVKCNKHPLPRIARPSLGFDQRSPIPPSKRHAPRSPMGRRRNTALPVLSARCLSGSRLPTALHPDSRGSQSPFLEVRSHSLPSGI